MVALFALGKKQAFRGNGKICVDSKKIRKAKESVFLVVKIVGKVSR